MLHIVSFIIQRYMFGIELLLKVIHIYNVTCVASIINCSVPYPS